MNYPVDSSRDMLHPGGRNYHAPQGITGEVCRHSSQRRRLGPSNGKFMVLADSCGWCGRILRSAQDLTWPQYIWIRRWNQRGRF